MSETKLDFADHLMAKLFSDSHWCKYCEEEA